MMFITSKTSKSCSAIASSPAIKAISAESIRSIYLKQQPYNWKCHCGQIKNEQKPAVWILKKVRKQIETVFSQLCDQFMIQRNYAKSFAGFKSRILAKVTGFTILQFLNKFVYNQPVGRVKHALAN